MSTYTVGLHADTMTVCAIKDNELVRTVATAVAYNNEPTASRVASAVVELMCKIDDIDKMSDYIFKRNLIEALGDERIVSDRIFNEAGQILWPLVKPKPADLTSLKTVMVDTAYIPDTYKTFICCPDDRKWFYGRVVSDNTGFNHIIAGNTSNLEQNLRGLCNIFVHLKNILPGDVYITAQVLEELRKSAGNVVVQNTIQPIIAQPSCAELFKDEIEAINHLGDMYHFYRDKIYPQDTRQDLDAVIQQFKKSQQLLAVKMVKKLELDIDFI